MAFAVSCGAVMKPVKTNIEDGFKLPSVEEFEKHSINFGNNPVDVWSLENACCFIDGHENYSCQKTTASKRIDGAIVFIMLFETLRRFKAEYMRFVK